MFKKIKKRIDDYLNRKLSKHLKDQKLGQQEQLSYAQLSQLFDDSHFIPMTTWSVSPSTILHLLNDIDINQRRCIVEFGSGASTLYIAKYLKLINRKTRFYSIESNQQWLSKLKSQIDTFELHDYVTLIYAPIEKVPSTVAYKSQVTWYATEVLDTELNHVSEIDVILVDGPFGGETPFARYSAIPFLKNKLASDFSVFLDDSDRTHESEIISNWKNLLNCKLSKFERYAVLSTKNSFISDPYRL